MSNHQILVLAAGSLGDAILTLPALQALSGLGSVTIAGTPSYLQLGPELLGVDQVTLLDPLLQTGDLPQGITKTLEPSPLEGEGRVRGAAPFPRPSSYFEEVFLFLKADAELTAGKLKLGAAKVFIPPYSFQDFLSRPRPAHHFWNSVVETSHPGRIFPEKPKLHIPASLRESGKRILEALQLERPILIHPGSGGRAKNTPLSFFRRAAEKALEQGNQVLVVWGEAEENRLGDFKEAFQDMEGVWRLQEPLTLPNLVGIMANSKGYLGNDSGPTHLASACGLPVFAVFGPTDPRVWAPPGADLFQAGRDFGVLAEVDPTPVLEGWLLSLGNATKPI